MNDTAEPVVIKAFAVIEVILAARRPLSLPELAEALGRPKQTVHRTARQLEEHGFLYREPLRDRYAIGPKLFDISKEVFGWCVRYAPRNAVLARLVEQVAETCNVGILDGDSVLYLDRVESNFPLRAELHPGSRVPVHCTGLGKLFLALSRRRGGRVARLAPDQRLLPLPSSPPGIRGQHDADLQAPRKQLNDGPWWQPRCVRGHRSPEDH